MDNNDEFMVAYSVSDKGKMAEELIHSLKSINPFINRDNVIIFYTPPYSQHNYNIFNKYAIVKRVDNVTLPFKYMSGTSPSRYGEIMGHLGKISSPNVFILDCDTIIKKNLQDLLEGNFDVAYRVSSSWNNVYKQKWEKLFTEHDKTSIPVPNKGFIVFKNNTHKKISKDFMEYIKKDLPHVSPYTYQKDQYAIALALSDYKIRLWDKHTHAFEWLSENNIDTYVLHGKPLNRLNKVVLKLFWKIKKKLMRLRTKITTGSSLTDKQLIHLLFIMCDWTLFM